MTEKPKNKAAQEMARLSHRVITDKRRQNARENGKKGGRPRGENYKPRKRTKKEQQPDGPLG